MVGKIIPEMIEQGAKPIIVAYENQGGWNIDAPLYTVPQFKPRGWWQRIPILRNLVIVFLEWYYYEKLYRIVKNIIEKERPDVAFSFSNPQASNLVGALIKKRLRLRFISHFSDPWYDNPYQSFSLLGRSKVHWLEKLVIRHSDLIVFTNDEAANLVMKKYPASWQEKSRIIPPCFDPKEYPATAPPNDNDFIIAHIGAFYKKRNPEALFGAIRFIIDTNPRQYDKIMIRLVGTMNDYAGFALSDLQTLASKFKLENHLEIIPAVNHKESLRLMRMSDCLVVIDAPLEISPFLPSKIVDYAGSNQPIIGITPKGSPTDKFLTVLGYRSFEHKNLEAIGHEIGRIMDKTERRKSNREFLKNFEVKPVVARWFKLFNEVMKK